VVAGFSEGGGAAFSGGRGVGVTEAQDERRISTPIQPNSEKGFKLIFLTERVIRFLRGSMPSYII
jgi:hypothetical protein